MTWIDQGINKSIQHKTYKDNNCPLKRLSKKIQIHINIVRGTTILVHKRLSNTISMAVHAFSSVKHSSCIPRKVMQACCITFQLWCIHLLFWNSCMSSFQKPKLQRKKSLQMKISSKIKHFTPTRTIFASATLSAWLVDHSQIIVNNNCELWGDMNDLYSFNVFQDCNCCIWLIRLNRYTHGIFTTAYIKTILIQRNLHSKVSFKIINGKIMVFVMNLVYWYY